LKPRETTHPFKPKMLLAVALTFQYYYRATTLSLFPCSPLC
jgi:hypothetical protein